MRVYRVSHQELDKYDYVCRLSCQIFYDRIANFYLIIVINKT